MIQQAVPPVMNNMNLQADLLAMNKNHQPKNSES
jgi:hypothetical protein